jgi:glycosyltransferase involved in cell wall biosynthesis
MRLAVVTTHPIQYYAPLFRLLTKEPGMELKIFYTWSQTQKGPKYDTDFGKMIEWDIPLLDGYTYEFVENVANDPGVHHFRGIDNPALKNKITEWGPDFLLVVGWNFKSHLSCMRHFKGKTPVLFRGDSTLLDEKPGVKKILRRVFLKWVYRNADYALYVGKNNHDYFLKHGLTESQLSWMPHAIDNERFHSNPEYDQEAGQWRRELGIYPDDLVLLFAGKLEPKKDPEFMLRLARNIPDPRLKLIIVGNGRSEEELKTASGEDERIIFLDFQNQQKMPLVYRLCDIFVLPSIGPGETWGLAVNEAMASERPVIVSSKCGCTPDLADENKTGWVFEPGNEGDHKIKNLLLEILENRTNLQNMGEHAWQKIQEYSYASAIKKLNHFLNGLDQK